MFHMLALVTGLWTCSAFRTPRRSTSKGGNEDKCIKCLQSADGGVAGCDLSCIGKSIDCQSCVHWEEDADCAGLCAAWGEKEGSASSDDRHKPEEDISDVEPTLTASDEVLAEQNIDWYDWNSKVSTFFTVGEVCMRDSRRIPTDQATKNDILWLARELDNVRRAWGGPILVDSWYRPSQINREVGGAPRSQHINGLAADIRPGDGNVTGLQSWLDHGLWKNRALGYGARWGSGNVHVDLRFGRIRFWHRK